ncbi:MAG: hypothetical protein LBN21_09285, partial [Treponema sp.]|nr:hypothetical protein [Treponema sp.]
MTTKNFTALVLVLILIPLNGFSQNKPDVKGFDKSVFDYHFSRADRELSPDRWIAEARRGIDLSLSSWEFIAGELYDDPLLLIEAEKTITQWSREELEDRFTQWLFSRFFGDETESFASKINNVIDESNLHYIYHLDDDGNIMYDKETGDPSFIRPGEEGRNFIQDLDQWQDAAKNHLETETGVFSAYTAAAFPELLSYIPAEDRSGFEEKLMHVLSKTTFNLKKQFEGLVAREERLFTARRTGDVWSLRKKSNDETAGAITARLISDAEAVTAAGIASLTARIEEAAAGSGDMVLAGTEWLAEYQRQFDAGLKAWTDAEERFFIRRIEWEQNAGLYYAEADEAWIAAYNKFEQERQSWELNAKKLFESGAAVFKTTSENLEKAIQDAKIEFERDMQLRTEAGVEQAKAWMNMYVTSSSVVTAAQENIQYWLLQYSGSEAPSLLSGSFGIWVDNEIQSWWRTVQQAYEQSGDYENDYSELKELEDLINADIPQDEKDQYMEQYQAGLAIFAGQYPLWFEIQDLLDGKYTGDQANILFERVSYLNTDDFQELYKTAGEMKKWSALYDLFYEKALEAKKTIVSDFKLIMGEGGLADVLGDDASSEDFNLDEYQIALLRAKAQAAYWEKQLAIAEAVSAYAEEVSAGRMTDAEGVRRWENAKANYEDAIVQYEAEQERLTAAGIDILNAQAAMNEAAFKLQAAEHILSALNSEYSAIMAVYTAGRSDYVYGELQIKYKTLLEEYRLLENFGDDAVYLNYLQSAMDLEFAGEREEAGDILKILINGEDGGLSLSDLQEIFQNIKVFDKDDDLPLSIEDYGLEFDNPAYSTVEQLLIRREKEIAKAVESGAESGIISGITERYRKLIIKLISAAKSSAAAAVEIREQGLRLFTAETGAGWYYGARGYTPSETEKALFQADNLSDILSREVEKSMSALLAARLTLEIKALNCFIDGETETDKDIQLLSSFCLIDTDAAEEAAAILNDFLDCILQGNDAALSEDGHTEIINWFVSGGSFFAGTDGFLSTELYDYNLVRGLAELYQNYGVMSYFTEKESPEKLLFGLRSYFLEYGIVTDNVFLPDVKTIGDVLFDCKGDIDRIVSEFLYGLDSRLEFIPEWIKTECNLWKESFAEYIAAKAIVSERKMGINISVYMNEFEIKEANYLALLEQEDNYTSYLSSQELKASYEDLLRSEMILSWQYRLIEKYAAFLQEKIYSEENARKHWRQYLTAEYIQGVDPALIGAETWIEGVLIDSIVRTGRNTQIINDALALYNDAVAEKENNELISLLNPYFADRQTSWNEEIIEWSPYSLVDAYNIESGIFQRHLIQENSLKDEIMRLGFGYEYSRMDTQGIKEELASRAVEIKNREAQINVLIAEYSMRAVDFSNAGSVYDNIYTLVKSKYTGMEYKRFLYEKEDAIRRWASTSYLELDADDEAYCRDKLQRANIALSILSDLYNNNEERRPYESKEYEDLYNQYKESFERMMLSLKVRDILNGVVANENQINETSYAEYRNWLSKFAGIYGNYENYVSLSDRNTWGIKDIIAVKNGFLAFSYTNTFTLNGVDINAAQKLTAYFDVNTVLPGEQNKSSEFEEALRGLSARMSEYFSDSSKYIQWGLARDHLMRQIINANSDISDLSGLYRYASELESGGSIGNLAFQGNVMSPINEKMSDAAHMFSDILDYYQEQAWDKMNETERKDLEFYLILTLLNGGGNSSSEFMAISTYKELEVAYSFVNSLYKFADANDEWYMNNAIAFNRMKNVNSVPRKRIKAAMDGINEGVERGKAGLNNNLMNLLSSLDMYRQSCAAIAVLQGQNGSTGNIQWTDINISLDETGAVSREETAKLKEYWDEMCADIGGSYKSVQEALIKLAQWARNKKEDAKRDLENQWAGDEQRRQNGENQYFKIAESFINGNTDILSLQNAADAAFGGETAARKNHLENLESVIADDLAGIMKYGSVYETEYIELADEYISLISRAYEMRYNAELAARETEWAQQRNDIKEKYRSWQEITAGILERGRDDWKTSVLKLQNARNQWRTDFSGEYNRISAAWNAAYLAGLNDKEQWLFRAAAAADNASTGAVLTLIGADAQMMARAMDTRDPAGMSSFSAAEDIDELLSGLMDASGITNLNVAFNAMNGIADTAAAKIKRGAGGGIWNAGIVQAAAANLVIKTNAELAERESKRLAAGARAAVTGALRDLSQNVDSANNQFRQSMDETFIIGGQWRRNGKNYIKDIIVHSTLLEPAITHSEMVEGYIDFVMKPLEIKTNLSESYLEGLDVFTIRGLIENMYNEVEMAVNELFGAGKDRILISKAGTENRYQDPGIFGTYIGYVPAFRQEQNPDNGKDGVLSDRGSGELGRLMTEYFYWGAVDNKGIALMGQAAWDKPIWDSRGSFFDAPTMRTVMDVSMQ